MLDKMISDIKNEIDESEKLRNEAKTLLDNSQTKLDNASNETNKIIDQTKKDSERLVIELNEKFHKSAEMKKKLAETKINQMKEAAIIKIEANTDSIQNTWRSAANPERPTANLFIKVSPEAAFKADNRHPGHDTLLYAPH